MFNQFVQNCKYLIKNFYQSNKKLLSHNNFQLKRSTRCQNTSRNMNSQARFFVYAVKIILLESYLLTLDLCKCDR